MRISPNYGSGRVIIILYYIIIIIIFGEKFDYPVNSIIRTGAGPVESGLPSFYCITKTHYTFITKLHTCPEIIKSV